MPGHEGFVANEIADELAKLGTECPLMGPEPAGGISVGAAKKSVRGWANRDLKNTGNL
jgi:hypothetical protein